MRVRAVFVMGIALGVSIAAAGQMMPSGGMMGGSRHSMINLVSPATASLRIARGVVMIGGVMMNMGGSMMGPGTGQTPNLRLFLRLAGVSDANGLVTNSGDHFVLQGHLTTADGLDAPVSVDQPFALTNGGALVFVPIPLPVSDGVAILSFDTITVNDPAGSAFALPGVMIVAPTPVATPSRLGGSCTQNSDCNIGEVCTPMGCRS